MQITDVRTEDPATVEQIARLLVEAFAADWPQAWPTVAAGRTEVLESLLPGRISRVAQDSERRVLGWIGAVPEYDGNVYELHPLVVKPAYQRQGIGRALVQDLEQQVAARGGLTIYLGTDDVSGMTSLSNKDLYQNLNEHLRTVHGLREHPFAFYQKVGFTIVGVIPDANGRGKPDIMMAKRVAA